MDEAPLYELGPAAVLREATGRARHYHPSLKGEETGRCP